MATKTNVANQDQRRPTWQFKINDDKTTTTKQAITQSRRPEALTKRLGTSLHKGVNDNEKKSKAQSLPER
jgi:hypothetical protein